LDRAFPIICLVGGLVVILLAAYGLIAGEVLFVSKSGKVFMLSRNFDSALFWFVEIFYLLGGLIAAAYGINELRNAGNLNQAP